VIDWFTVAAQIINFLILVALLKYFLYGRILAAMDQRQADIASLVSDATQKREQAEIELADAREKKRDIEERRDQMLMGVRQDVEEFRQQLNADVRSEIDELRKRWADAIEEESDSFLTDLKRRTCESICLVARAALKDLAGAELESQIIRRFLQRIERLDDVHREQVIVSLRQGMRLALVQTSFELQADQQAEIARTLESQLLSDLNVQFETSDDLLCGIALQTNSHKLAWDLRDFMTELEQDLRQTLEEEVSAKRGTPAAAIGGNV